MYISPRVGSSAIIRIISRLPTSKMELQGSYPENLRIVQVLEGEKTITIKMRSKSRESHCHHCGQLATHRHGTYARRVQDLSILGKQVVLDMRAYEFDCDNDDCEARTFSESFDGFLSYYARMTERCADFVCTLALETSCSAAARICREVPIKICGETVARMLLRRYEAQPTLQCGSVIGVDDFAFKKRHRYGTIIVDGETHQPVVILDGRDANTLKEWLQQNKHVTTVTRDRASAYAKAIREVLPDAMQIADRFHLHQNLLEAVKSTLNSTVPANVKIPKSTDNGEVQKETSQKKRN